MFMKNCPSSISFTHDEIKAALVEYINRRLMSTAQITAIRVAPSKAGGIDLIGITSALPTKAEAS